MLASMSHPNIVEIFDIGEFEEDGKKKPYFVMPLLPGATLDNLIRQASHRLTVERTMQIMSRKPAADCRRPTNADWSTAT